MEAPMIAAKDRTRLIKLQEYILFGKNIKIFIKLYNTRTIFIKYVDIFAEFKSLSTLDACKDAHLQRQRQNFPIVQFQNCLSKRRVCG